MKKIWLVAKETFIRQTKGIGFILSVLSPFILIAIVVGIFVASDKLGANDNEAQNAIVVQKDLASSVKGLDNFELESERAAQKDFKNGDIDGYAKVKLSQTGQIQVSWIGTEVLSSDDKGKLMDKLNDLQEKINLQRANLNKKQAAALNQEVSLKQTVSKKGKSNRAATDDDTIAKNAKTMAANAFVFLAYFLLIFYVSTMAQEITTEKGSKIMEIIFSSMRGEDYFIGKVLGIIGVFLFHVVCYLLIFGLILLVGPKIDAFSSIFSQNQQLISQVIVNLLSWSLIVLFLSVVLCIVIAAFFGALTNRVEDLQKVLTPFIYIILIGFFFSQGLADSTSLFAKILSAVPILSGFILPPRLASGAANSSELVIASIISLVTMILAVYFVRKVYPRLILQTDEWGIFKKIKKLKKN